MAAPLLERVEDRWPQSGAVPDDPVEQLLLASNLLGSDRRVANFGGGNTSVKVGDGEQRVLWVKGSGSDLATMGREHLAGLRFGEVERLFERTTMSDEEMVGRLTGSALDTAMPRASIETLLHAFIPAPHVHHTHPDAINALASAADGERLVRECFGDAAAWIPYIRPGFTLSKQVGAVVRDDPALELVVLAKHGLVCWGESAEQAYRTTTAVIRRAADFVNDRVGGAARFDGPAPGADVLDDAQRAALLREVAPALRGALSSRRRKVLVTDRSPRVVELVGSVAGAEVFDGGAACPDHLVHTKRVPLWVPFDPRREDAATLRRRVVERAAAYREAYERYVERHAVEVTAPVDPDARVVLIEHVGLVAAAPTPRAAALARDLYHRTIEVMAGAHAVGGYVSLTEAEGFAMEYWPLELDKLSLAPAPGELEGTVVVVADAARASGRAVAAVLEAAGACVADAVDAAIDRYGGVDLVVGGADGASATPAA